ncbi:glycosyltransferase [Winslowiella toletana]|nr:glycosyltransferase [Winslowiella toletana]
MYNLNLTTTRGRLDLCSATVWSLIHQTFTPDTIIIWVSREPYMSDEGINEYPGWLPEINRIKNIVKIVHVRNTGPYRKIIPALRAAELDDVLIYADDDVIYGSMWLETLLKSYHQHQGKHVIAARIRVKSKNVLGFDKSYNHYKICATPTNFTANFIITGVGGCVIARRHVRRELLNIDAFIEVAPKTDDLWISKIIELSGTTVTCSPEAMDHVLEINHSNNALSHSNTIISLQHTLINKIVRKIYYIMMGYFGFAISNNDTAMKKINAFFKLRKARL